MNDQNQLIGNGRKTQGQVEQMDKRIEALERLYRSVDRKLWVIIALAVGAIIAHLRP